MMKNDIILISIMFLASIILARNTQAKGVARDAKADQVMRRMSDFLSSLDSVNVTATFDVKAKEGGRNTFLKYDYGLSISRPRNFSLTPLESSLERSVDWYHPFSIKVNESNSSVYLIEKNKYIELPPPKSLSELSRSDQIGTFLYIMFLGAEDIIKGTISDRPYDHLMENAIASEYIGIEPLDGADAHHIRVDRIGDAWDLWIAAGENSVPVKLMLDTSEIDWASKEAGKAESERSIAIQFRDWMFNPTLKDEDFVFIPTDQSEKTHSFFGHKTHPTVSQEATEFKLRKLDGSEVNLGAHLGKDIVVLEFWASWCGPCIKSLPAILKIVGEYRDRGVVFYAVNKGESISAVQRFVNRSQLDLNVILDERGKVCKEYGVSGIPHTVIIDQNGNIRSVHVGLRHNLATDLRDVLDEISAKSSLPENQYE